MDKKKLKRLILIIFQGSVVLQGLQGGTIRTHPRHDHPPSSGKLGLFTNIQAHSRHDHPPSSGKLGLFINIQAHSRHDHPPSSGKL